MKATTNLMLKLAPEVSLMVTLNVVDGLPQPTPQEMDEGVSFTWPLELEGEDTQDKRVWTQERLTCLSSACERLLRNCKYCFSLFELLVHIVPLI